MRAHRPAPTAALALLTAVLLGFVAACSSGDEAAPASGEDRAGHVEGDGHEDHGKEDEEEHDHAPEDATVPESAGVTLSRDGLSVVAFGDEAEAALEALRTAIGRPNSVTRWLPMDRSLWGECAGDVVRGAKWGDLWVIFSDESEITAERRHVSAWLLGGSSVYGQTKLRTPEGIGVGSTVEELRAAYGERLSLQTHELGADFTVAPAPGEDAGGRVLTGTASGDEADDRVRTLQGGIPCEK